MQQQQQLPQNQAEQWQRHGQLHLALLDPWRLEGEAGREPEQGAYVSPES